MVTNLWNADHFQAAVIPMLILTVLVRALLKIVTASNALVVSAFSVASFLLRCSWQWTSSSMQQCRLVANWHYRKGQP